MKPGLYTNISEEQYHADTEAISSHGVSAFRRSPLHYWSKYKNPERLPQKETPALKLGTAIHRSILEPDKFEEMYVKEPEVSDYKGVIDKLDDYKEACRVAGLPVSGTKEVLKARLNTHYSLQNAPGPTYWDELYSQIVGTRITLSRPDYKACRGISWRVHKHPAAKNIFSKGKPEVSIFWNDVDTGVLCRGRMDWLTDLNGAPWIVDIKSTTNASSEAFHKDVFKYGYHIQAAMYWDGLKALGIVPDTYVFSVWEKYQPYATALYHLTPEVYHAGQCEYKSVLKSYSKCLETDSWPGYSNEIEPLYLPEWYGKTTVIETEVEGDWLDDL